MKFDLNLVENNKVLRRKNVDGKRHYFVEGSDELVSYPSVTTVLSMDKESQNALHEWRRRVGAEQANKVARHAASRGTASHKLIEDHIQNIPPPADVMPHVKHLFNQLKSVADRYITDIRMIEGRMVSDHLRAAGTVDLIAKFDGVDSVIDWKTSSREKSRHDCRNYFTQESAYSVAFEENFKIAVPRLVTIIAREDSNTPQIMVEKRDDWIARFIELRQKYDLYLSKKRQ